MKGYEHITIEDVESEPDGSVSWLQHNIDNQCRYTQGLSKMKPEQRLQISLMRWLDIRLSEIRQLTMASAGGLWTSRSQSSKMKSSGYLKGTPDLFFPFPRHGFHGLFVELKEKSIVSKEQRKVLKALGKQGYKAVVCKGWEQSIQTIKEYFNVGR